MADRQSGRSLIERLEDTDFIERAMRRGVRQALLLHKQTGRPIVVWRDGQVVWIAPEDIEIEPE
jgi:hypothetical protein